MNKKYIFLFLLLGLLVVFLNPINAFNIQELDKHTVTYINGKSVITVSIVSSNFVSDNKMKKDLNSINKIVVKVNNKTVNTIKKGVSWNKNKYYPTAIINRKTIVKGNIKNKKISILTYDSKNKLIKSRTNNITSIYLKPKLTKNQATKLANKVAEKAFNHTKYDVKVVFTKTINYGNKVYWGFKVYEKKTNKWLDGFVMDEKGKGTKL